MTYNIFSKKAPAMPRLGKGLESISLMLSQVSEQMREPVAPMLFPILGAQ